ncbi:MAG: sulfurtransferase TusA family protein [Sphaerochaeta sp.]|jgi:TusA-related sulfurtransferase|nr:sulfurtransferase TusA family protein [Sphaerochaeta sp.]MCI2104592.1 sulfurtransferase TusA family protein [Sphaerochaeta sp.]MCI2128538.1 sulfurtransferase TusA family protein [Sphaerochaeta sp.]
MREIDARGLSCPQPVVMTKKALADKPEELKVLVDNRAALENVTRYAKAVGYTVTVDGWTLDLKK